MKYCKIFLALLFLFISLIINAQQIEIENKGFNTPKFYQNGKEYKMGELITIMKPNYTAVDYMKKARVNNTFTHIFTLTGGFLAGWPIGTSLAGGNPNWDIGTAGGCLIALSIPFLIATHKNSKKAVDLYNEGYESAENTTSSHTYKLSLTGNGVSLALQF